MYYENYVSIVLQYAYLGLLINADIFKNENIVFL